MNLVSVQSSTQGEDYIVTLVYQTLGATFVQVKDDDISEGETGLRVVNRTIIAEAGTDYVDGSTPPVLKQVGVTTINSQVDAENAVSCTLASYEIVDTDSYREVKEVYMQPGTLSETKDKVGSQLSIVKETFASTPAAISGYSIANEQESNVDGIATKRFTFLKDDVKLSDSEDKVGSQNAITEQWFKPIASDPSATPPVVGREIKTGYSLAKEEISDVQGIPTKQFTFLKDDVKLSQSDDKVGSQKAITEQWFKPDLNASPDPSGNPPTYNRSVKAGYELAKEQESDVEGIPTLAYTFLKPDVKLSDSEDKVGSQLAITEQWFKPSLIADPNSDPVTVDRRIKTGYSLAKRDISDVEGIPTEQYTFLKDNVILSVSQDRVGSQLSVTNQVFKPTSDAFAGKDVSGTALVGYSEATREKSDFAGIPTISYTFLKGDVQLSESTDNVGSEKAITEQWFKPSLIDNPTANPVTVDRRVKSGYSLAKENVSDVGGIPTERYTFLKDDVKLSDSNDKVGSQLAITEEWFKPVVSDPGAIPPVVGREVKANYELAREEVSDVEGIPTRRYTFLKSDVKLSESEDEVGSQNAITEQWFKPTNTRKIKANYSLAKEDVSDVQGIPTEAYTFLKDDVQLSKSEDKAGSQNTITEQWFNPTVSDPGATPPVIGREVKDGYSLTDEQKSDISGIPTIRYTFSENDVKLSDSTDKVGSQNAIVEEWFNPSLIAAPNANPATVDRRIKAGYNLAKEDISNVEGIPTQRYTFLKPSILSVQKDLNSGLRRVSVRAFDLTDGQVRTLLTSNPPQASDTLPNGSSLISEETSDFDGIKTRIFNFEFHEVFTENYDLNGLKRIEQRKFSTSDFTAGVIGGQAGTDSSAANTVPEGSPLIGLYLSTEEIDNGGKLKTKVSNWIEAGTLKKETRNISDGLVEHTTKYIAAKGTAIGPVVDESIDNFEGLKLFNVVDVRTSSGATPVPSEGTPRLVNSFENNVTFKYPGVVSIQHDKIYYGSYNSNDFVNVISTVMRPPVEAKVTAQADVYIQDSGSIVAADYTHTPSGTGVASYGFWNPTSWAEVYQGGVGWGNAPFSETQALRGYRADLSISQVSTINSNGSTRTYVSNGVIVSQRKIASLTAYNVTVAGVITDAYVVGTADSQGAEFALNSRRLYTSTPFQMRLHGGPVNPSNKQWVLDVKIEPAFEGSDGTQFYRKTILTASIP
jgi:hypothetical protein